jgi:hypothetical protein
VTDSHKQAEGQVIRCIPTCPKNSSKSTLLLLLRGSLSRKVKVLIWLIDERYLDTMAWGLYLYPRLMTHGRQWPIHTCLIYMDSSLSFCRILVIELPWPTRLLSFGWTSKDFVRRRYLTYMNMTPDRPCICTYMIYMVCILVSSIVDVHLKVVFISNKIIYFLSFLILSGHASAKQYVHLYLLLLSFPLVGL